MDIYLSFPQRKELWNKEIVTEKKEKSRKSNLYIIFSRENADEFLEFGDEKELELSEDMRIAIAEWKDRYCEISDAEVETLDIESELCEIIENIETPIPAMSTSEFLYNDGPFTFWDTPEELKGKPNYYITDDDRAFWWDGTNEVQLSVSMEQWLEELAECHKQIMQEISDEPVDANAFLKLFIEILAEADSYYKRIFCFQNMFYEFLQSGWTKEYVAAIRLFQKLMEDNREDGK